jgi:hypothetical protein
VILDFIDVVHNLVVAKLLCVQLEWVAVLERDWLRHTFLGASLLSSLLSFVTSKFQLFCWLISPCIPRHTSFRCHYR